MVAPPCSAGCRRPQPVDDLLQLVDRLVVEAETVVVAVAHDALLVDHDHRALDTEARREGVIGAGDLLLDVGQQRNVQRVLGDERLV
jgi:hypothetical protein